MEICKKTIIFFFIFLFFHTNLFANTFDELKNVRKTSHLDFILTTFDVSMKIIPLCSALLEDSQKAPASWLRKPSAWHCFAFQNKQKMPYIESTRPGLFEVRYIIGKKVSDILIGRPIFRNS